MKPSKNLIIFESLVEKNAASRFLEFESFVADYKVVNFHNFLASSFFQRFRLLRPAIHLYVFSSIIFLAITCRPSKVVFGAPVLSFRWGAMFFRLAGVPISYLMPFANIKSYAFAAYGNLSCVICDEKNADEGHRIYSRKPIIWKRAVRIDGGLFATELPNDKVFLKDLKDIVIANELGVELCLDAYQSHNQTKKYSKQYEAIYDQLVAFFEEEKIDATIRPHPRERWNRSRFPDYCDKFLIEEKPTKRILIAVSSSRIEEFQMEGRAAYYIKPSPKEFDAKSSEIYLSKDS